MEGLHNTGHSTSGGTGDHPVSSWGEVHCSAFELIKRFEIWNDGIDPCLASNCDERRHGSVGCFVCIDAIEQFGVSWMSNGQKPLVEILKVRHYGNRQEVGNKM